MNNFWMDCRFRVTVDGPAPQEIDLDQPFALIGSHHTCDVVLNDPNIPARCFLATAFLDRLVGASLCKAPGKFRTISSKNGIKIGEYQVRFEVKPNQDDTESQAPQDEEATVSWYQGERKKFVSLRHHKPLLLGRKAPSQLKVPDDSLSSVHACLVRTGNRLCVIDLASTNGTFALGKQVSQTILEPSRSFTAGKTKFRFRGKPIEPAPANENAKLQDMASRCHELADKLRIQKEHLAAAFTSLDATQRNQKQVDEKKHELDSWKSQQQIEFEHLESDLEQRESNLTQRESDLNQRSTELTQRETEVARRETDAASKQEELQRLEVDLRRREAELNSLAQEHMQSMEVERQKTIVRNEQMRVELIQEQESLFESSWKELDTLETILRRRETELETYFRESRDDADQRMVDLEQEKEFTLALVKSEHKKLDARREELEEMEGKIEQTRRKNEAALKQIAQQLDTRKAKLVEEYHDLQHQREQVVASRVQVAQKLAELERRASSLEEFKQQLNRQQARLQKEQDAFLDRQRRVVEADQIAESLSIGRENRRDSEDLIGSSEFLNILDQAMKNSPK